MLKKILVFGLIGLVFLSFPVQAQVVQLDNNRTIGTMVAQNSLLASK